MLNVNERKKIINEKYINIYGYEYKCLFDEVDLSFSKIKVFSKVPEKLMRTNYYSHVEKYFVNTEICRSRSDLVILDNSSIKCIIAGYPLDSKNVLISLNNPRYWIYIFVGIIRRLILSQIKLNKIITLKINNKRTFWLHLINLNKKSGNDFYFSDKIGIAGLLNYLRDKKINYVVMRFYQKLPNLYDDEDSDLDILVSNYDEDKLKKYLISNKGNIKIDVWNETAPSLSGVSYYLPFLAKKILNNAIPGPANSRVPCKKDALMSLIYHSLYHKGINAGIESTTIKTTIKKTKYFKEIKKLEKELGEDVGSTMEEMDYFLKQNGWQPNIDTLAKFSLWNEWVKERFFNTNNKNIKMRVFILKKIVLKKKLLNKIIELIKNQGFTILDENLLEGEIKNQSIKSMRGGVWRDLNYKSHSTDYEPAYALILMDLKVKKIDRFNTLKNKIRNLYNELEGSNIVHSSDTDFESWDYISICFPNKTLEIKKHIDSLIKNSKSITSNFYFFLKLIPYFKEHFILKFKSHIIKIIE